MIGVVESLPSHDHCEVCDDPIDLGERFCSDECRTANELELRKERNKNLLFMIVVISLFAAMTIGYFLFGQ